jgi:hypothetical protein
MRAWLFPIALVSAPALAQGGAAGATPNAQGELSVTVYNNNLALVQDRRQIDLAAGRVRIEFPDVSAQIRSETVSLAGQDVAIVEQNFDFDLLSPSALMEKAVGETITIVRTNPATGAETRERATVLAANGGVVLQIGERIEVLRDDGLPVRVIFDRVPENLRARPTLSVTVDSRRAGRRPLTLTYLTPSLSWQADYVALFDEGASQMDVQGWITLTNNSGTTFHNASTTLVAGGVGEGQQQRRYYRPQPPAQIRSAGTETADRERLGDFYLYPLAERTTIANQQTKQISFLDVRSVAATRGYEFRVNWLQTAEQPLSASSVLSFSSARGQGLGDALPAGTVRVYQRDARGSPQFVGESPIPHTPMGSRIALTTGSAFDVQVRPVVVSRERITHEQWQATARYRIRTPDGGVTTAEREDRVQQTYWQTRVQYRITNARPVPVTLDLHQFGLDNSPWHDSRIVEESHPSERPAFGQAVWRVAVPANGAVNVEAVFQTRY